MAEQIPEAPVIPAAAAVPPSAVAPAAPPVQKDPFAGAMLHRAAAAPPATEPAGAEPQAKVVRDPFARSSPDPQVRAEADARAAAQPNDPFAVRSLPKPGIWESIGRGAVEGGTFGWDASLGMDKEARERSRAANPWSHFSGELLGGLIPMAAAYLLPTGAGQVAGAARGATMLRELAGLVRAGMTPGEMASLGQAIGQTVKLGTVYGGLSGMGHADSKPDATWAESLGNRALGTILGAGAGALTAPLVAVPTYGATRLAQGVGTALYRAWEASAPQGHMVNAVKRLEWDRISPQDLIDQIYREFPSATQAAAVPGQPNMTINTRFWGPITQRQPWTAEQIEHVVSRSLAGESPQDIAAHWGLPAVGGRTPGQDAVETITNELARRYLGPTNLVDRAAMVRMGSGENTQMGMRVAAATPGEATATARERLLERAVAAQQRFHEILARFVGNPDFDRVAAQHEGRLAAAGQRLYGLAEQNEQPFDLSDIVQRHLQRTDLDPAARAAIEKFAPQAPQWSQTLAGALRQPTMPATEIAPTGAERAAVEAAQARLDEAQQAAAGARNHVENWLYQAEREDSPVTNTEPPPYLRQLMEQTQDRVNKAYGALKQAQEAANVPVSPPTPGGTFANRTGPTGLGAFQVARKQIQNVIDDSWRQTNTGLKLNATGRDLVGFVRDITRRVRDTNEDWAAANDAWRDGKAAEDAMAAGADMSTRLGTASRNNIAEFTDAQRRGAQAQTAWNAAARVITGQRGGSSVRAPNAQEMAQATPAQLRNLTRAQAQIDAANSRQELFRVGFARSLSDKVMNTGETHDLARSMLLPGARQIIGTILGDDAQPFLNAMRAEAAMHRTYAAQFGSQTTPLAQGIREDNWAPRFELSMTNPMTWIHGVSKLYQDYLAQEMIAARNARSMAMLTDTNPINQLGYLRQMQQLYRLRRNWGVAPRLVGQAGHAAFSGSIPGDYINRELPRPPESLGQYRTQP